MSNNYDGLSLPEQIILLCHLDDLVGLSEVVLENEDQIIDALQNVDALRMAWNIERSDLVLKLDAALRENTDLHAELSRYKTEIGNIKKSLAEAIKVAEKKVKTEDSLVYRVTFVESERGWGQKYEYSYYATEERALRAIKETNAHNTASSAPDWYYAAIGQPEPWALSKVPQGEKVIE